MVILYICCLRKYDNNKNKCRNKTHATFGCWNLSAFDNQEAIDKIIGRGHYEWRKIFMHLMHSLEFENVKNSVTSAFAPDLSFGSSPTPVYSNFYIFFFILYRRIQHFHTTVHLKTFHHGVTMISLPNQQINTIRGKIWYKVVHPFSDFFLTFILSEIDFIVQLFGEVRELEKCALKLAKSGCTLLFNGACLKENVLPNYSNCLFLNLSSPFIIRRRLISDFIHRLFSDGENAIYLALGTELHMTTIVEEHFKTCIQDTRTILSFILTSCQKESHHENTRSESILLVSWGYILGHFYLIFYYVNIWRYLWRYRNDSFCPPFWPCFTLLEANWLIRVC